MGGLFKAPKPVIVPPAPVPETVTTVAAPAPSAQQQGEQARAKAVADAQQGMEGLIATSPTGVLTTLPAALTAGRKSLLGQ
jgi:hypothetical protein